MNFKANLAVFSTGVELRTPQPRKRLLVDQLEHVPLAHKPATPLLRASYDFEKVRVLTGRGADVNAHSQLGALDAGVAPRSSWATMALALALGDF